MRARQLRERPNPLRPLRMQEATGEAYFRQMAEKCRRMANELTDAWAAESLRNLAVEYDVAANAQRDGIVRPNLSEPD